MYVLFWLRRMEVTVRLIVKDSRELVCMRIIMLDLDAMLKMAMILKVLMHRVA
jgi:hypothetical protein